MNNYFYDSTVLRHIALRVWSDLELQKIIRDLVKPESKRISVYGSNLEIVPQQLSGAVVATPQNFYRFRNDLVMQFSTSLIQYLDNVSEDKSENLIPSRIIELEKIVKNCQQTLKFSVFLENLENVWRQITDYPIKSENIIIRCFAAYQNDDGFWYVQNKPMLEAKKVYAIKDSYENKIDEIIRNWKIKPGEWFQKKHTFFQWTDETVTFIYTLEPGENALFGLSISIPRSQVDNEFTEFKLGHWIRFIKRYRERIIQFILQEIGEYALQKNNTGGKQLNSGILNKTNNHSGDKFQNMLYWTKEDNSPKFLTTPSSFAFLKGKIPKRKIVDINERMQQVFSTVLGDAAFKKELGNIFRFFYLEFRNGMGEIKELCNLDDNSVLRIESHPKSLNIPFELIPFRDTDADDTKDYLTTRVGISRRLKFDDKLLNVQVPFHLQFLDLQERGEPFRVLIVADNNSGELENVAEEVDKVEEILNAFQGAKIRKPLFVNSIEDIEKALSEEQFHLLHFCGHAEYDPRNENKSGLSIPSVKDGTRLVSYGRFAQVLKDSGLWMVYLSCCYGAPTDIPEIGQTYLNCVEALIREGIPNVLSFRWAVEDKSAMRFAEEFYKELFENSQVKELNMAILGVRKKLWNEPKFLDVVVSSLLVSQTN